MLHLKIFSDIHSKASNKINEIYSKVSDLNEKEILQLKNEITAHDLLSESSEVYRSD